MTVHIGRLQKIGFGRESVASGTEAAASAWLPKREGGLTPVIETVDNENAYGSIVKLRDTQAAKESTDIAIGGVIDDKTFGHMLMAALGTTYASVKIPVTGVTGTFAEGEVVTESVSTATATVRRVDVSGGAGTLYVVPVSGTLTGGQTLTGGTSSATATGGTLTVGPSAGRSHLFRLLNSNNHPSYSFFESNPIGDFKALYCMMDELDIEVVVGQYATFTAKFQGKKVATATTLTPSFVTENPFLAKFATFKYASAFSGLGAASAVALERFKLTIKKNLELIQAFGSNDINSIHNKAFEVSGDFDLKYDADTIRALVSASTSEAFRLTLANTDVALGTTNPTLQIDIPQAGFTEWSKNTDNDGIIRQTVGFVAEYNIDRSMSMEAVLINAQTTAY